MKVFRSSPFRASVLFLALASIGSTGCMTVMLLDKVDRMNENRKTTAAWQRNVDDLRRAAEAGDPRARIALVEKLDRSTDTGDYGKPGLKKALAMLTESAEQDDGPAQSTLGEYLLEVSVPGFSTMWRDFRDNERGIYWLQRASTHGCRFKERGGSVDHDVALDMAKVMAASGRQEEALAWEARSAIECRTKSAHGVLASVRASSGNRADYVDRLALVLLLQDEGAIDEARRIAPAADLAAAEKLAERARPRIAAIQREFPRRAPSTAISTDE